MVYNRCWLPQAVNSNARRQSVERIRWCFIGSSLPIAHAIGSNSRFGNFAQAHRPKRADAGAQNDQHRLFYGGAALKRELLMLLDHLIRLLDQLLRQGDSLPLRRVQVDDHPLNVQLLDLHLGRVGPL